MTPIQYQEIKKLRHNPYVGGGYIRSHKTLFHDLHLGYWAKERMAAREDRKRKLVREVKRPRLEKNVSTSSLESDSHSDSESRHKLEPSVAGQLPAKKSYHAGNSESKGASLPQMASTSGTKQVLPSPLRGLASLQASSVDGDSSQASPRGSSPNVPASVLDVNHGKSRKFQDYYTFEKGEAFGIRRVPKIRSSSSSGDLAGRIESKLGTARQLGTAATSGSMVGRGAYSSVRVGTHIKSGDRFAIKLISKRYLYSEEEREAIRREVRIHCSPGLAHQNIVFLYDYFEDDTFFYLVMDHCEGGDLQTYMRKHKRTGVTEWQAQMLFMQLMKALAFLHDQNIIHGDIKPQNVLLSKKPFSIVKICDFGNARYAKDVRYFSKTGSVSKVPYTSIMGTQGYIAPEILAKKDYGPEIDVWAAGIMCFTMLGGYQPYHPASACLTAEGPNFNDPVWQSYSEECRDFITKLLQRDPATRLSAAEARTHPWIVAV